MQDRPTPKGQLVIQVVAMPSDTNANGDIFGGWLVSYMDMGAGIAAKRRAHSRSATVAINSLIFIRPVKVGDTVSIYADLLKVGKTSMQFNIEVWALAITEEYHEKVAQGLFTFVAIDESGKPHHVDR